MAKFRPGQSGNPAGRPRGIRNTSSALREAIQTELPSIIQSLLEKAKGGDIQAATLLLSRALPPLRPEPRHMPVNVVGDTLADKAEAIGAAALSGDIASNTAHELMGILATQAKVLEISELLARIENIEKTLKL